MKIKSFSIALGLLIAINIRAQTTNCVSITGLVQIVSTNSPVWVSPAPVSGRVTGVGPTSFSFTNQTPTILECMFTGGSGWTLTKDGITNPNPINGYAYFLLQPNDYFSMTFPFVGGPFFTTNALYLH
jgi:hypothetical protein